MNPPDFRGATPADYAREEGKTECAIFLALKSNDVGAMLRAGHGKPPAL